MTISSGHADEEHYLLKSAVDKHMEDAQECLLRQYSSEN
jgi:hypothetical protein